MLLVGLMGGGGTHCSHPSVVRGGIYDIIVECFDCEFVGTFCN